MMIHLAEAVKVAAATSTVAFQWDDAARFENGLFSFAQQSYARAAAAKREELSFVGGYLLEQGAECALTPAADGYAELCLSRRSCALSASSVTVVHSCGVCAGNPLRSGEGDSCAAACGGGQFAGEAASWGERQCQCADGEGLVGGSCVLSTVAAESAAVRGGGVVCFSRRRRGLRDTGDCFRRGRFAAVPLDRLGFGRNARRCLGRPSTTFPRR